MAMGGEGDAENTREILINFYIKCHIYFIHVFPVIISPHHKTIINASSEPRAHASAAYSLLVFFFYKNHKIRYKSESVKEEGMHIAYEYTRVYRVETNNSPRILS